MGDRYYQQQAEGRRKVIDKDNKPRRKLKADWIKDIETLLATELSGLSKTDITTLKTLYEAINVKNI